MENKHWKPIVGKTLPKSDLIIARVHDWDDYWDLEVIDSRLDESGYVRIMK